ncbi:MAG: hypothetical protein M1834_003382 [Cirrosporium novae-zelandiae]|nr:MAG: hypothetical protein M1834_003382 [Cirrosporium novae-zelandiae]
MTAVASPTGFPSLPRLGWNNGSSSQGGLNSMGSDDVSRMFMHRKSVPRSNSSSSLSSSTSNSTVSMPPRPSEVSNANADGTFASRKKTTRGIWPASKAEAVAGITNARTQPVASPSTGSASSAMSAIHQSPAPLPSQHLQSQQLNGVRVNGQVQNESQAILVLLPMNGTFERKHITVPVFPEVLKIGRQTNAKTLPTPVNGYFDSKVLSRQHAEIWSDQSGKIWIRDVKSSNGTFVNGQRLSPESKDSDPHQLREHDMLELGIDIVSEDQKTIVHHKVSAKVERAGIYRDGLNLMDLNLGPGSTASVGSNARLSSASGLTNGNMGAQQRQINFWLAPMTVEQVVKRLSMEMNQAKKELLDLDRAEEVLTKGQPIENEPEKPKNGEVERIAQHESNGASLPLRFDHNPKFSEPPVPPPQLPLPDTPESSKSSPSADMLPHSALKRNETEKPKLLRTVSPNKNEHSSQILTLLDALQTARREIDSQGVKVKELEDLLLQERAARESAEKKILILEARPNNEEKSEMMSISLTEPLTNGVDGTHDDQKPLSDPEPIHKSPEEVTEGDETDASAALLQQRLDLMVAEMDEMKQQMERYRHRAEAAEEESSSTRNSLAEMVERIQQENAQNDAAHQPQRNGASDVGTDTTVDRGHLDAAAGMDNELPQGTIITPGSVKELEQVVSMALSNRHPTNQLTQAAPFASMLGVVLLGVGLMAYLNSWQKLDR